MGCKSPYVCCLFTLIFSKLPLLQRSFHLQSLLQSVCNILPLKAFRQSIIWCALKYFFFCFLFKIHLSKVLKCKVGRTMLSNCLLCQQSSTGNNSNEIFSHLAECYSNTDLFIYAAPAHSLGQKGGKTKATSGFVCSIMQLMQQLNLVKDIIHQLRHNSSHRGQIISNRNSTNN